LNPVRRAAPYLFVGMLVLVLGLFAYGMLTGGDPIRLHEQDHGVRQLTVCYDAEQYLMDHQQAELDWRAVGCRSYPVTLGDCLDDPRDGEVHVHLCDAHPYAALCDDLTGTPGHTQVREGGAGVITYAPGAAYDHVRHEAGHLRLSEGHSSIAGSWMAASAGPDWLGVECGGEL